MTSKFDFNGLFIFEMANNHQGSLDHGLEIIRVMAGISNAFQIRGAIKLQFRNLDTFIHPNHKENSANKHIPRFISTRLKDEEFKRLVDETKKLGLISIVTPFDELSVDLIEKLGVDVVKIGSPSANDWPLLERVSDCGKPVIVSTGGLRAHDIDKIVSFFQHRGVHFAIMHCVSIYPTPNEKMQLNQIELLRDRYPGITIGFSTHEHPDNLDPVKIAYAKGARIFEKHVGIANDKIKLNTYSAAPEQVEKWIVSYKNAVQLCGGAHRPPSNQEETASLRSLMRGVYAKRPIKAGSPLLSSSIYFAMPPEEGQLLSGDWKEHFAADKDYSPNSAIADAVLRQHRPLKKEIIASIIHELKGALNSAKIFVGQNPNVELSHHYGLDRFREHGTALIDCINREYCKKIIIQLPGQKHPYHFHKKKEEAFQVLQGRLIVNLAGNEKVLYPGDVLVVPRAAWHGFYTHEGAIFEEVSTTHFNDDSFYEDSAINRMPREERKTKLVNWGSHQFD